MKVACLVPYPLDRVPGQRFRLEQWARPLATEGITFEFFPLLSDRAMDFLYEPGHVVAKAREIIGGSIERARWAIGSAPRSFDAVAIHREAVFLGIDWIEKTLVRRIPVIYDFDDAIWLPVMSDANKKFRPLRSFGKVDRLLRMCTGISAGCEYLAEHARRLNPLVAVVPTSIDLETYGPPREHRETKRLTVGWSGSVTTARYLEELGPTFARAAAQLPMALVVLGANVSFPGVDVRCIPWSPANEVEVIRTFDVGLKPVAREEWVRGKCPMKDIQYMALGVPPIATRFGTSLESITDGATGYLCETESDWLAALGALQDVERRRSMGANARTVVEARYSSVRSAKVFAALLHESRRRFAEPARIGPPGAAELR